MRTAVLVSVAAAALLAPAVTGAADAASSKTATTGLRGLKKAPKELLLGTSTDRPARVILPQNYHDKAAWPVVMVLHGYGSNGRDMDFYAGISREAPNVGGFITIQANGTYDPTSHARFWNGKACCDHNEMNPNDKAYLVGLVDEAKAKYNVDPAQVYAFGHSNGGLMAQILVCQESDTFKGMVGLSPNVIPGKCWETKATKVLLVSGTVDLYLAPCVNADNAKRWGGYFKCGATPSMQTRWDLDCEAGAPADYDSHYDQWKDKNCALPGAETAVEVWEGCEEPGGKSKVALWTMEGSSHSPALSSVFTQKALRFLLED